jgi:hypothetical protein
VVELLALLQPFKVAFAADSGSAQVVLDDEDWDALILWNDYRAQHSGARENHVIAHRDFSPVLHKEDGRLVVFESLQQKRPASFRLARLAVELAISTNVRLVNCDR